MSTTVLEILQVFLVVLGALPVIFGIQDSFGEGQQSSVGHKKIVGGLALMAISWFIMSWAIKQVQGAEAKAGLTDCILPVITQFSFMIHPGR